MPSDNGYDVTLESPQFARAVWISTGDPDAAFSDNYMDLLPEQPVTIKVYTSLPLDKLKQQLKVLSMADACL